MTVQELEILLELAKTLNVIQKENEIIFQSICYEFRV